MILAKCNFINYSNYGREKSWSKNIHKKWKRKILFFHQLCSVCKKIPPMIIKKISKESFNSGIFSAKNIIPSNHVKSNVNAFVGVRYVIGTHLLDSETRKY